MNQKIEVTAKLMNINEPNRNGRIYPRELLEELGLVEKSIHPVITLNIVDTKVIQLYLDIFNANPYRLLSLNECWRLWKNLHDEPTHYPIKINAPNWFKHELKKMMNQFGINWYIEDSSFARKAGATNDVYRICGTPQFLVHLCGIERPEYKGE